MNTLNQIFIAICLIVTCSCASDNSGNFSDAANNDETNTSNDTSTEVEKNKPSLGLYIKRKTAKSKGLAGSGEPIESDSVIKRFNDEYLEIELSRLVNGNLYARKYIKETEIGKPFYFEFIAVSDSIGNSLEFATQTDFLNFMSIRGYKLVSTSVLTKHTTSFVLRKD